MRIYLVGCRIAFPKSSFGFTHYCFEFIKAVSLLIVMDANNVPVQLIQEVLSFYNCPDHYCRLYIYMWEVPNRVVQS